MQKNRKHNFFIGIILIVILIITIIVLSYFLRDNFVLLAIVASIIVAISFVIFYFWRENREIKSQFQIFMDFSRRMSDDVVIDRYDTTRRPNIYGD